MNKQQIQQLIEDAECDLEGISQKFADRPYPIAVRRFVRGVESRLDEARHILWAMSDAEIEASR